MQACQLKTIPPRLLADLLGGMVGLVLGGQDHTPYPFGPRPYHTIPRKKLEPWLPLVAQLEEFAAGKWLEIYLER